MRDTLARYALAMGLLVLAPVCTAKSYVVLLKNPIGMENHVHIINSKGVFGINDPGYGTEIGKNIQTVHRYTPEQIKADFSGALEGMSSILAAGLPPLEHSYVALLELPQGPLGKIDFTSEKDYALLDQDGEGVLIDGYSDDSFQVDKQQVSKDFGPALASLDEIIKAGFRPLSYIVLLEDPSGSVGKVTVTDERGKVLIDEAGESVDMGDILLDQRVFKVGEEAIKQDFGHALDYTPPLPSKYVFLFQSGSTKLTDESKAEVDKMLEDVENRPAPDITVDGHADTVGRDALNDKLSKQRAEFVAEMIRTHDTKTRAIDVEYYGEHKLFIKTRDNTPEIRNRRVEVTVR
jgi:peptidoglycan-associated lipoprotein